MRVRIRAHKSLELLAFVEDDGREVRVRVCSRLSTTRWRCDDCGAAPSPHCKHARAVADRPFPLPTGAIAC